MQTQTDIRGLEHRILVREQAFDSEDDHSDMGKINKRKEAPLEVDDNASRADGHDTYTQFLGETEDAYTTKRVAQPHPDHAGCLMQNRGAPDAPLYKESEVDIVLDMIKNSYGDFKRTDIMKPFYLKALQTLRQLLLSQKKAATFKRVCEEYKEITLENTIKLLLRCRLSYQKLELKRQMQRGREDEE